MEGVDPFGVLPQLDRLDRQDLADAECASGCGGEGREDQEAATEAQHRRLKNLNPEDAPFAAAQDRLFERRLDRPPYYS